MGEIADGLINGDFDFHTGEYLGRGQGFPRTARGSLTQMQRKSEDLRWKKVTGFLNQIGIKQHLHPQLLKDYGCDYTGKRPLRKSCFQVLKDFDKFKKYATDWKLDETHIP